MTNRLKRLISALLTMLLCINIFVPLTDAPAYAASAGREFAVHITWVESGDPDTYVNAYNSSGGVVGTQVYHGHKNEPGISLDKDDTKGANSAYENETTYVGSKGGEWITLDFDELQKNGVAKVNIKVKVRIPTATITATVVDKKTGTIVTKSYGTYTGSSTEAQIGFLVQNGSYWDFVNADGQVFSGSAKVSTLKMNLSGSLVIPTNAQLKLVASYAASGHTDTRTWTKAEVQANLGGSITYNAIEQTDTVIKLYWVVDGVDINIGTANVSNGTDGVYNITSSPPTCQCTITIGSISNITKNIGVNTGYEMDLASLGLKGIYKTNGCYKHGSSGDSEITPVFSIVGTATGGTASLNGTNLSVEDIDTTATVKLRATVTNIAIASTDFTLTISRTVGAPEITSATYNSVSQQVTVKVNPNGHKIADIYIADAKVGTIEFKKNSIFGGTYQPGSSTFKFTDIKSPNTVKDIKIARSVDDITKAIISWTDQGDKDNMISVYAIADGQKSSTSTINVKDTSLTKRVYLNSSIEVGATDINQIEYPIRDIAWDSNISIKTVDDSGNESGLTVLAIPNSIIYNTTTVDDAGSVNEGLSCVMDLKANDRHDQLYPQPTLASVEILEGKPGLANLIDSSQLTDGVEGMVGLILSFSSADGTFGDIKLKYTYNKVRDDIPAAVGYAKVNVIQRNQEPVVVDDTEKETSGINAEADSSFNVPFSVLLANDSDRESSNDKLKVAAVRNCSAGIVEIQGTNVVVTPNKGYYGYITFEYRAQDPDGALSNNWAKVTVYVKNVPKPPVAYDVDTQMQLSDKTRVITLNVSDPSGEGYKLSNNLQIFRNGVPLDSSIMVATAFYSDPDDTGESKQYIQLTMKDTKGLKENDVVTIPYTVSNRIGSDTATVSVKITKGVDINDMEGVLYVHRRPVALMKPYVEQDSTKTYVTKITISPSQEVSYDLDHQASHELGINKRPDYSVRGLRTWEWGIKTLDGSWNKLEFDATTYGTAVNARQAGLDWINAAAKEMIANNWAKKPIVLSLRVRDIDGENDIGVWSEPRTMMLASVSIKPVALFTLDKSTYVVPEVYQSTTNKPTLISIIDMSYDANGDALASWKWVLTDPNGKEIEFPYQAGTKPYSDADISKNVSSHIMTTVNAGGYNPKSPTWKLSLVVKEATNEGLDSDKYSVSFDVYKENKAPIISDKPTGDTGSITSSTLYQIDNGADGTVGDDWGKAGNAAKKGTINFPGLFTITDDQPVSNIIIDWLFEGQKVTKRSEYIEDVTAYVQKSYSNKKYSPFESPFTNTVTDQGFLPGAYKLLATASDNPNGGGYAPGSGQTTYWQTSATSRPYHFYVVPKLDMFMHSKFNGWIDQSYREEDGKTLAEAGLSLEDIVPTIGDTIDLYGSTNQFVNNLWGYEDYNNNNKFDAGEKKFVFVRTGVNLDSTRNWEAKFTIEDIDDAPPGSDFTDLRLRLVGETTWGSETEEVMRTKQIKLTQKVMPVKLFDFRVTSLTDPDISEVFDTYMKGLSTFKLSNGSAMDGVPVGKLAVDRNTTRNAGGTGTLIRKGYSFYFSVGSKGLTKSGDEVRITPKFYSTSVAGGVISIGSELAGYVPDDKGVYQPYTTGAIPDKINTMYELFYEGARINSLNTHADIRIPISLRAISGSEQTWVARYGIPADAKFFKLGSTLSASNEYTGDILVTFDIKAYKNGKARYDYVQRGQWLKERNAISDALKTVYKAKEADWKAANNYIGTVIVYNGSKSVRDDYISNPVWKE